MVGDNHPELEADIASEGRPLVRLSFASAVRNWPQRPFRPCAESGCKYAVKILASQRRTIETLALCLTE